jgi:hypothetical protein
MVANLGFEFELRSVERIFWIVVAAARGKSSPGDCG